MTKIDIVSGFLGAGKTTLIKKLLAEAFQGEKLVLIENEFGEISIDGGFLKESGVQISEMSSGCICCSLVGDFNKALKDVHQQFAPDRILIEPSGVGKLSDVIVAVENTVKDVPDMKLNSFVTVADATKVKVYMKNFGEFYNNQIESAKCIVLSRTQKLSEKKLDEVVAMIREKAEEVNCEIEVFQSNHEGAIIDRIQAAYSDGTQGIVINPGAFTHYSYAIHDALQSITTMPKVEIHISDITKREGFRAVSVTKPACDDQIYGKGFAGYLLAIDRVLALA